MTKNPLINAVSATLYIVIISFVMFYGGRFIPSDKSIFGPITVLSLFSLSAAIMGYVFLYQPGVLFMENKRKEAVGLFLKTVGIFAGLTFVMLLIFFWGIFS